MARLTEQLIERLVDHVVKLSDENARLKLAEANRTIDKLREEKNWLLSQYEDASRCIAKIDADRDSLRQDVEELQKLVA